MIQAWRDGTKSSIITPKPKNDLAEDRCEIQKYDLMIYEMIVETATTDGEKILFTRSLEKDGWMESAW